MAPRNTIEDFHKKYKRGTSDECWIWNGAPDDFGYGRFRLDGKTYRSHNLSLTLAVGVDPARTSALHSCDNPPCVNPSHLRWGTPADNMRDRTERGRSPDGEKNTSSKLTEGEVLRIRELYATGNTTYRKIAAEFGVSYQLINYIVKRKIWDHI